MTAGRLRMAGPRRKLVLVGGLWGALTLTLSAEELHGVWATGIIRAVKEHLVLVPRIQGTTGRVTLTWIVPSSATVQEGDIVAEFDRTQEEERARETVSQYEDLQHKVEQKKAENRANAEQRAEEMEQAKAELAKARIQLRIAPVLAEIERLKNKVRLQDALERVSSLETSHALHREADQAALRLLEIQADRQKTALDRAQSNMELLVVRAPYSGMVAHEYVPRGNTRGPPQIGDQIYRGYPLLRIFDPSEMEVVAQVGEPDGEALVPGAPAIVILDAYPDLRFPARLRGASPVASAALTSPIRQFQALFTLDESDPHLLPDLSVAVVILGGPADSSGAAQ